jgi:hypothetical protein
MTNARHNQPSAPTNTPQHLPGDQGPPNPTRGRGAGNATSPGPHQGPQGLDTSDPHPAEEGHPYDARHPGGANPPTKDIGPNPAVHEGGAPARPHNADSGPEWRTSSGSADRGVRSRVL